jgi:hypothetical protein
MSRRLLTVLFLVCCAPAIAASARGQGKSTTGARTIVLEVSIVATEGSQVNGIATTKASREAISRLIADGKANLIASLHVRARTGQNFSAKAGQRIPIQTSTAPVFRTNERSSTDSRESLQSQGVSIGVPRIEYENTGLVVEGVAIQADDGLLEIRLKIELIGVDQSTGRLTPTLTQRTLTDVVKMKDNETAMLMGLGLPPVARLHWKRSQPAIRSQPPALSL